MGLTRRRLLALTGLGAAGSAIEAAGLLPPFAATPALADTTTAGRGLFGGPTTLDRTVLQSDRADLTTWTDYVKLRQGPGEPHALRMDLWPGVYRHPTRALEAFVQITDLQLMDDKSPARVEFTDSWADLRNPWNPLLVQQRRIVDYRPTESPFLPRKNSL